MSDHTHSSLTSADMRHAAYAAPTGSLERQELVEAERRREQERLANLGDAAATVVELERKLGFVEGERRRAASQARSAQAKLEEMHQTLSTVLGRDSRSMGLIQTAFAMSQFKTGLTRLAGCVERAETLEDLAALKRIVTNMGIKQPTSMTEQANLMGLPSRKTA